MGQSGWWRKPNRANDRRCAWIGLNSMRESGDPVPTPGRTRLGVLISFIRSFMAADTPALSHAESVRSVLALALFIALVGSTELANAAARPCW